MTTRFVGIEKFRQNVTQLAKSSKKNNQYLESFAIDMLQGVKDAKAGKIYSQTQIESLLAKTRKTR